MKMPKMSDSRAVRHLGFHLKWILTFWQPPAP